MVHITVFLFQTITIVVPMFQDSQRRQDESQLLSLSLCTKPSSEETIEETTSKPPESGNLHLIEKQGRNARSSNIDGVSVDNLNGLNLSLDFKEEETSRESDEGSHSAKSSTQAGSDVGLVQKGSKDLSNAEGQACVSPENSSQVKDENMYEQEGGSCSPNKKMKTSHDTDCNNSETIPSMRKARVSVRVRCETPTVRLRSS